MEPLLRSDSTIADPSPPFQIRGSSFTLLTLKVTNPRSRTFFGQLAATLSLAPGFYRFAPIVLDFGPLARTAPFDLTAFCAELRRLELIPVGFQGATADWEAAALAAGLSVFPAGRATEAKAVRGRGAPLSRPGTARVIAEPVRSGQQVYARESDLIVTAQVSRGAELLADGHIHVYGPLRGRALAGMGGDPTARIFCGALDADLVSIAGTYLVSEQMESSLIGKPVQIRLAGDRLVFERL